MDIFNLDPYEEEYLELLFRIHKEHSRFKVIFYIENGNVLPAFQCSCGEVATFGSKERFIDCNEDIERSLMAEVVLDEIS